MANIIFKHQVEDALKRAGINNWKILSESVIFAIKQYDEYKLPRYYSYPKSSDLQAIPRLIKRPLKGHSVKKGRYDQEPARIALISSLAVVWIRGTNTKPTVSDKRWDDSPFVTFVIEIFSLVRIGKVHRHLERYVSVRKNSNI